MAHRRVRTSTFDNITKFVLNRVEKHRKITVFKLKRILRLNFGSDFFCKRRNLNILMDTMEYLLYTKRLTIISPNQLHGPKTEMPVIYNCNNAVKDTNMFSVYKDITKELLAKFEDVFKSNSFNVLSQNICTQFDPFHIAISRKRIEDRIIPDHYFSFKIKCTGNPISNQKSSGRCWIFACLNVIRVPFMKRYCIKQFEFSQAHLYFWDKIERCNYFLNAIVLMAKKGYPLDSRTAMCLLKKPIEDGGYWNMAVNIIKKHGLMPKLNFPESYSSENSNELNEILNSKLREFAIVLYNMVSSNASDKQISNKIKEDMCVLFRIVGICLDIPKQTFKWYYRIDGKEPCLYQDITPLEFYERFVRPTFNLEDKVSLISDPRPNNRFGQLYTIDLIGNVTEGSKIVYNNQPMEVLLEACEKSLSVLNEPVWYSCEVNQRFSSKLGFHDLKIHDIQSVFDTDLSLTMTKSERILYRDSSPTHAMVLTGFRTENGEVTQWCVENSWGKRMNRNGYIMMTTEWFKEYVFEVIVDKSILPACVLDVFYQEPIVLPIWDQLQNYSLVI